jgi:hypothetical protein
MTITTLDGYIGASKQLVEYAKLTAQVTAANIYSSMFDRAGQPGAGTLVGSSTNPGVVPDGSAGNNGYPKILAFGGGNTGYLTRAMFASATIQRLALFDRLFVAGDFGHTTGSTTVNGSSYAARVPNTDYSQCEIWIEVTAAFPATATTVSVTYTDAVNGATRTTPTVSVLSAPIARCIQFPLQAGDSSPSKIESVNIATGGASGGFSIMVLRPLLMSRIAIGNVADTFDILRTGAPQVYATSALYVLSCPDSTSSGTIEATFEIANG